MPRIPHGTSITVAQLRAGRAELASLSADVGLAFAVSVPGDLKRFDYLFPELQLDDAHLLPTSPETREALVELGIAMEEPIDGGGDSDIPAVYTYFGQFVDHDITLEAVAAPLPVLTDPALAPLPLADIRTTLHNARTATLDLDSVYSLSAPLDGDRMLIGTVTALNGTEAPELRPANKGNDNDLPREPRNASPARDRAALIGDPRNDENTIIAQLHVAFLRAHNALVDAGASFEQAQRMLRQHYQWLVIHDFLPRIADPVIIDRVVRDGSTLFNAGLGAFFMPIEFSMAAYRFGHSMVRAAYDFNVNFNTSGDAGTTPATLDLLFLFTALQGELTDEEDGTGFETLPDNWIIEWERLTEAGGPNFARARRFDPFLVEPLFRLRELDGKALPGNGARLAVRNLLRGYLLRLPTGQAVAKAVHAALGATSGVSVLSPEEVLAGAANDAQRDVLVRSGMHERTPLWFYLLAEANVISSGARLGPLGSTLIAEVLVELARHSTDSILAIDDWRPTLPSENSGTFVLTDLFRLAGVLA